LGYANLNGILKRDNMERSTLGVSVTGNFLDNHLKIELNNYSLIKVIIVIVVQLDLGFDPTQL
jgi:iron complex outermembrane receptor protein